ncbi:MAG: hypothetical protein JWQ30_1041, partial [Sediminibacterium sp.]|nr:hypothetical protein [Sediminibacterium sp.]
MKQIILSIVVTLTVIVVTAQTEMAQRTAYYEAAGWKTKLVDNPQQVTIP